MAANKKVKMSVNCGYFSRPPLAIGNTSIPVQNMTVLLSIGTRLDVRLVICSDVYLRQVLITPKWCRDEKLKLRTRVEVLIQDFLCAAGNYY